MIEAQVRYVLSAMRELRRRGADWLDLEPEAQRRYNERLQGALRGTVWSSGCTSWYQQADGRNFTLWPWSTVRYWLTTRRIDAEAYRFATATAGRVAPTADSATAGVAASARA
jgi:hypothetical protein